MEIDTNFAKKEKKIQSKTIQNYLLNSVRHWEGPKGIAEEWCFLKKHAWIPAHLSRLPLQKLLQPSWAFFYSWQEMHPLTTHSCEFRRIQFWPLGLIFHFFHSVFFIKEAQVISKAPGKCICLKQVAGQSRDISQPQLLVSRATISLSETIQTPHLNTWCIVHNAAPCTCLDAHYSP